MMWILNIFRKTGSFSNETDDKSGVTDLFKEVRVFKETSDFKMAADNSDHSGNGNDLHCNNNLNIWHKSIGKESWCFIDVVCMAFSADSRY